MLVKDAIELKCHHKRKKNSYGYWKTELLYRQPDIWFYHDVMSIEIYENQSHITKDSTHTKVSNTQNNKEGMGGFVQGPLWNL